jgi:hypothetical protein
MTGKHLRQSMCQTAYQTLPWSPDQFKVKSQFMIDMLFESQADRIGAIFRTAKQCLKKLFCPFLGEQSLKLSEAQNFFQTAHCYIVIPDMFTQAGIPRFILIHVYPGMSFLFHE